MHVESCLTILWKGNFCLHSPTCAHTHPYTTKHTTMLYVYNLEVRLPSSSYITLWTVSVLQWCKLPMLVTFHFDWWRHSYWNKEAIYLDRHNQCYLSHPVPPPNIYWRWAIAVVRVLMYQIFLFLFSFVCQQLGIRITLLPITVNYHQCCKTIV